MSNDQKPATLDDVVAALLKNQETLEEIKVWAKIIGVEKVQDVLKKTFDSPEKITIYHLSDGRTVRDIVAVCGGSTSTVSNYWNSWNRLGLMKSISVKRGERFIKSFDLESYGIEVPAVAKKESKQTSVELETKPAVEGEIQNEQ